MAASMMMPSTPTIIRMMPTTCRFTPYTVSVVTANFSIAPMAMRKIPAPIPTGVLDEPTVGLDPVLRQELWAMFTELATAGTTLFISSHVMDEARRCTQLALLRDGRVLTAGRSPDQLLADTGADDVEDAFLRLVEQDDGGVTV